MMMTMMMTTNLIPQTADPAGHSSHSLKLQQPALSPTDIPDDDDDDREDDNDHENDEDEDHEEEAEEYI